MADQGRCLRRSTSSDVAERAVADQGRPQCSMSGDMAKRRVRGQWQTGGGILDAQRQVTWQRRVGADQGRRSRRSTSSDVAEQRVRAVAGSAGVHVV